MIYEPCRMYIFSSLLFLSVLHTRAQHIDQIYNNQQGQQSYQQQQIIQLQPQPPNGHNGGPQDPNYYVYYQDGAVGINQQQNIAYQPFIGYPSIDQQPSQLVYNQNSVPLQLVNIDQPPYVYERPNFTELENDQGIQKLVSNTQNLISNADVININNAAEEKKPLLNTQHDHSPQAVASENQKLAEQEGTKDERKRNSNDQEAFGSFSNPIIVDDCEQEVNIVPKHFRSGEKQETHFKQINVEIIGDDHNNGQYLKETTYPVKVTEPPCDDDASPLPPPAKPVKQKGRSRTTTITITDSAAEPCDDDKPAPTPPQRQRGRLVTTTLTPKQSSRIRISSTHSSPQPTTQRTVTVTQRPAGRILAPIQAGLRLSSKHPEDCGDDVKTVVEVQKNINIKNVLNQEKPKSRQYGSKLIQQPIIIEKPVDRIIKQNVYIEKPVDRIVKQNVYVEKPVPYPVERIVEKQVHVPYPVEKRVPYPVEVEKIVEKKVTVNVPVDRIIEKPVPYPVEIQKLVPQPYPVEKIVEKKVEVQVEKRVNVPYPVEKIVDRPVHHYIDRPYPVEKIVEKKVNVPYPVDRIVEKFIDRPVHIEKQVRVEVPVDRIVEKPVEVEKIITKEIKVPYPVTKYVDKYIDRPVEVEKIVEKPYPVEVTKYIDRPYPVEKIVEKQVPVAYPVEKIVEKIVDRPVEVEKIVEKQVHVQVPYEVERIVEKIVDRPVTVEKIVDRPYPVEKVVEKFIDRPYPVQVPVEVHVPVHYPVEVPVGVPVPYPVDKYIAVPIYEKPSHTIIKTTTHETKLDLSKLFGKKHQYQTDHVWLKNSSPVSYYPQHYHHESKHVYLPPHQHQQQHQHHNDLYFGSSYASSVHADTPKFNLNCVLAESPKPVYGAPFVDNYAEHYGYNPQPQIYKDDYVGPTPLLQDHWATTNGVKFRRSSNYGKSLRIEYGGFKPPLVPSLEIDEHGTPLHPQKK